jgi:hypothetical protein
MSGSADYATRQDLIRTQEQSADLAERIALEFRNHGLAGVAAISESPNVVVDISSPYPTFSVTLTADRTLSFVGGTAALDRRKIILEVTQGTTGGWLLTPDSSVVFGSDIVGTDLSIGPGETDVLGFMYIHSINKYRMVAISHGY